MSAFSYFENIELLNQGWLWLWPVCILITLVLKRLSGNTVELISTQALLTPSEQQHVRVVHPLASLLMEQSEGVKQWNWTMTAVIWLTLLLLLFALSQPVRIGEKIPEPPQQRDIVLILDTSVSMLLRDYVFEEQRIDRMSLLKGLLNEFVEQLDGERVAVVIFGDSAYTYIPLTQDLDFVRIMLSRIQTTMAGRFSAVGEAIALAVKQAKEQPERKRILVLFTAANQITGTIAPQAAAKLAQEAKLPLYTVAIGAGSYQAEEKNRRAGLIYHPVDYKLLQQLSEQTGAKSYLGSDPLALKRAIADIDQAETNVSVAEPLFFITPLYPWPLGLAMMIVGIIPLKRLIRDKVQ